MFHHYHTIIGFTTLSTPVIIYHFTLLCASTYCLFTAHFLRSSTKCNYLSIVVLYTYIKGLVNMSFPSGYCSSVLNRCSSHLHSTWVLWIFRSNFLFIWVLYNLNFDIDVMWLRMLSEYQRAFICSLPCWISSLYYLLSVVFIMLPKYLNFITLSRVGIFGSLMAVKICPCTFYVLIYLYLYIL